MSHGAHAKRVMAHKREGSAHGSLHSEFAVHQDSAFSSLALGEESGEVELWGGVG